MSNLNSSLEVLFNKMEGFISSKTVVGEPINIGNVIIVPLVDISIGVGAGSYERKESNNESSGGGLGGKLTPSAMLVVQNGSVQNSVNKIIDMVPGVVSKLNLSSFLNKDGGETSSEESTEDK